MLSTLLPFMLFAFVASITPGPTNILVLSNSARYGFKAAMPIILGACVGAAGLVLVVGAGVGQSLTQAPKLQAVMQWAGVAWLSYLAWQIYRAPAEAIDPQSTQKRLGLIGAASLQVINPKTWMMALAVVSVFAGNGADRQHQVLSLSLVFFLIALPCLGAWALLGAGSNRVLRSSTAVQRFNRCMALLLLGSTWLSVLI
ncbi:LysE family translocator [Pseudomonas rhodesiae]|jgi:threonine/homoserine/homoserine lactone efflux protein|uniref:LysE family translocator n=1 Tax=Pseudomonas rhodesiae TaxID=76760 RepID=UPI000B8C2BDC|nr:LysE family translocator [Pseudomonas rhodesiae]OXS20027.1 lysine transporter LysE [Pseudomonas fluorescens]OZO47187.1 lysine transporter LysE [Pseudomonas fluorescens]QVN03841.1 LysE family translocator [Pseudomonas rhodesiae]TGY16213.1 LysE family translocator [Pseudomonas fluorescens]WLG41743.1 LysE family translocator [Pseudomonas rhodesiae]